jgi:glycosyltransferase involved in cell wall biosynthesis
LLAKVSIIIPVYNAESYLRCSIESLLLQTYGNIEIIIVDDASADNSLQIVRQFESEKIHVVQQDNSGAAIARNMGLKYASGEYIQFMDVDDFLSTDKMEKQVAALQGNPGKVAVCNYINFTEETHLPCLQPTDQSSFIYSCDDPAEFLINLWGGNGQSNFIQTNSWLVPKSVIDKSGGWREYRCPDDDGEFFARVLLASSGIVFVPGVFNYYRRTPRENKLSQKSDRYSVENVLLTIGLKYEYLKAKSNDPRIEKAFAKQYLDFAVHQYPQDKELSKEAYKKFEAMNEQAALPVLGGTMVEGIKNILGWKTAQLLKYYIR